MNKTTVLLAGCDRGLGRMVREKLPPGGYEVIESPHHVEVLHSWQAGPPAVLVIGPSQVGTWDGLDLARDIRQRDPALPITLINSQSSEDRAIAALHAGVSGYFKPPYSNDEVVTRILRTLPESAMAAVSKDQGRHKRANRCLIGDSAPMVRIKTQLQQISVTDCTVLITGETGTGKERVAEHIHQHSPRQGKPLVRINCAALPDGLLESELFGYERGAFTGANASYEGKLKLAEGGTVFFDEIGDMSPYGQAKILRVIETKEAYRLGGKWSIPFDFRVLAATNQDLERLVAENKFRKDLFFRIDVARIHLPLLKERREDIPLLVDHCLQAYNASFGRQIEGLTPEAWSCVLRYRWPGNVRELNNMLEAILIARASGQIAAEDLPERLQRCRGAREGSSSLERELLLFALSAARWNKSEAAKRLRCSRMTLYRKMAKHRIDQRHGDMQDTEARCNSQALCDRV